MDRITSPATGQRQHEPSPPARSELHWAKHHLISCCSPSQNPVARLGVASLPEVLLCSAAAVHAIVNSAPCRGEPVGFGPIACSGVTGHANGPRAGGLDSRHCSSAGAAAASSELRHQTRTGALATQRLQECSLQRARTGPQGHSKPFLHQC